MPTLTTLRADAPADELVAALDRDGACIVADVIDGVLVGRVLDELDPYIGATGTGRDDFTGRQTTRTGALVARSPACREVVMNPPVLAAAQAFLGRQTERILLHLTQVIRLLPGQGSQALHRDRVAWGKHLPASVEPQFNTMWAFTDFTNENGATLVAPGSHRWEAARSPRPDELAQAAMAAGSVLLYTGSVIHGGGENRSAAPRTGINITYCLGWLRTEENQYLSCPPDIARTLEPGLQELLGYTMGSYALGYYSDPAMPKAGRSDIHTPEHILGRRPREPRPLLVG
jgi:ectoine hydroxylase-related dioxygenase (phytanoyl-CoA dioxygenase family)